MTRRSGRPAQLAEDPTVFDGARVDVDSRVGWLLRTSRLASENEDDHALDTFAKRLRERGLVVDASRLSTWESGRVAVPEQAFAHYGAVLGLAPGSLRTTCSGLRDTLGPPATRTGATRRSPGQEALQRRLDRTYAAVADGRARGGDWLAMADLLGTSRQVILPSVIVEGLVDDLVHELVRSVGPAYTTRFQALTELMASPGLSGLVTASVESFTHEVGAQGVLDALCVLGEVSTGPSLDFLLASLVTTEGATQLGAAYALLNLLITTSFPAARLPELEQALGRLHRERSDPGTHGLVRLLGRRLPRPPDERLGLGPLLAAPEQKQLQHTTEMFADVAAACATSVEPVPGADRDGMLRRLLQEALGSRFPERRHQAGILLMASPYRDQVARATATLAESTRSATTRRAAAVLLTYVAGPGQSRTLLDWLSSGREELQDTALISLAHGGGGVPGDVDLTSATGAGQDYWAAAYAAGMSGHPVLKSWASDPSLPAELRQAARWWLATGGAVRDTA